MNDDKKMKVVIFDSEKWEEDFIGSLANEHDLQFTDNALGPENASDFSDAEAISVFMYSSVTKTALESLPQLKLIVSRSTGVDHIDTATCRDRGITVSNVPSYGKNTVAEHVFALLLMISHRMEEAVDRTRKGDFSSRGLSGFDLDGKTMGVIGTGDIGTATIRIAKGFAMNVLAFDVEPSESASRDLGFQYVGLGTLLEQSDVVSLHVPSTPKTRDLLSDREFSQMKDGVVLINTARGDIVDVRALARALVEGKVSAAGMDVLPNEPVVREEAEVLRTVYEKHHDLSTLLADEVLVRMRNVVVTPHSAFNTREAVQRILETTVENIRAFSRGKPANVVTVDG